MYYNFYTVVTMEDESKIVASSSSNALAVTIPDVTMEAAAVEMTAPAEWSPSPSPTAASSSEEEDEEDDDTLPQDDLAFARAVARCDLIHYMYKLVLSLGGFLCIEAPLRYREERHL